MMIMLKQKPCHVWWILWLLLAQQGRSTHAVSVKTPRPPTPPRAFTTMNPFRLTPVEAEYLSGVALFHSKYSSGRTFGFFAVQKLYREAPLVQRAQLGLLSSTGPWRVRNLLYSYAQRPSVRRIEENIETVEDDPHSRQGRRIKEEVALKAATERIAYLVSEDLNNIRDGIYPIPSELRLNKIAGPAALSAATKEIVDIWNFAQGDTYEGSPDHSSMQREPSPYLQELASHIDEKLPDYYMTDFHSVPGGFLSPKHAAVYDNLSEFVFSGTHFMARRMLLRPIFESIQAMTGRHPKHRGGNGLRLLDIGTGTGTFLIQLREAFPDLELEGLDLSPAMLEHAQSICRSHPSFMNRGKMPNFVRASMEDIPKPNSSFDFVTETNCFHEMPTNAIQNVAREAARVLKRGGMFLHMDAVQMKDDPSIASTSRVAFDANFNEPFMTNWMEQVDLDDIFGVHGLEPVGPAKPYLASTLRVYRKVEQK